jgi:SAM-dependent methyltransferase
VSEFASTYDALAPRWEEWTHAVTPDPRPLWIGKIDAFLDQRESVVELGCGTGAPIGVRLASRYDYTGVDASPGMLARARVRLPEATFIEADMEDVTFARASLGAVVALYSIIHVPRERHAALFVAIASWLRPGGAMLATVHSRDSADDYQPDWLGGGPMRWSGFDGATNLALIEAAGMEIVESEVIEQVEPEGTRIRPLWVFAVRNYVPG